MIYRINDEATQMVCAGPWRAACVDSREHPQLRDVSKVERHLLSGELFLVFSGQLRVGMADAPGEALRWLCVGPGEGAYVPAGMWHATLAPTPCRYAIIENTDTGAMNTETVWLKHED